MESVTKIYPTPEECVKNNLVKCTEEGCTSVFTSESNLTLHLVKSHKKSHLWQSNVVKQYHCPDLSCIYYFSKHFKSLKYLRQHYMQIHAEKTFGCDLCKKNFSTELLLKNHSDYCNIQFKCCDCEMNYPCYDTLKTHCRRKKHKILNKAEYKSNPIFPEKIPNINNPTVAVIAGQCSFILPKPELTTNKVNNSKVVNQGVQTEDERPKLKNTMTQVSRDISTSQNTQQTQTGFKYEQLTVETQTVGDFVKKTVPQDLLEEPLSRKNIETQTNEVVSRSQSSNTSFRLQDFEFNMNVEKNSSGTQTGNQIYSSSTNTHDSIHTDTSDLLSATLNDNLEGFDSSFFNCHTETQTDFMLHDDLFNYCDYYSNMHTQTCDDILNGLGFNDIETQTVFNDMLRSVEIQTVMSHSKNNGISSKDMNSMQTQTDVVFQEMLEEIHS